VDSQENLTQLLHAWSGGDQEALERLAPLVQQQLREIARRLLAGEQRANWQPTELVQESYLRLLDWRAVHWENRSHFFATVARMMRHAIIDAARARRTQKRGMGWEVTLPDDAVAPARSVDVIALGDALDALATFSPRAAQVVELRFFGGFSVEETAETLGVSSRTVINDWNAARAWLHAELAELAAPPTSLKSPPKIPGQ
jgi:RNA polymerase sigma factor (TIGR02999 family)